MSCRHDNLAQHAVTGDFYAFTCQDCGETGRVTGMDLFAAMKRDAHVPNPEDLARRAFPTTFTIEEE